MLLPPLMAQHLASGATVVVVPSEQLCCCFLGPVAAAGAGMGVQPRAAGAALAAAPVWGNHACTHQPCGRWDVLHGNWRKQAGHTAGVLCTLRLLWLRCASSSLRSRMCVCSLVHPDLSLALQALQLLFCLCKSFLTTAPPAEHAAHAPHRSGRQAEHAGGAAVMAGAFAAKVALLGAGLALVTYVPLPKLAREFVYSERTSRNCTLGCMFGLVGSRSGSRQPAASVNICVHFGWTRCG